MAVGPLIGVSLLQYCIQVISVMFVGHLRELPLSGASMATSFASVTGFSVLVQLSIHGNIRVPISSQQLVVVVVVVNVVVSLSPIM
ncbi:hypothetical protein EUGRSUZ_B02870, partial [Eucalyptus grandis]